MENVSVTITGRLGFDPKLTFTDGGTAKVTLSVAAEPRHQGPTRWYKVVAFGAVATHAAESLVQGDRVTVRADDIDTFAWMDEKTGKPRSAVYLTAYEIAASVRFGRLTTDFAAGKASGGSDLADTEQVPEVLAGVTA